MPELVPPVTRESWLGLIGLLIACQLVAGCQTRTIDDVYGQGISVRYLADHEPGGDEVSLEPADVERRAPALADALTAAKTRGTSSIDGETNVRATWAYLDDVRGKESRSPTTVRLGTDFFRLLGTAH